MCDAHRKRLQPSRAGGKGLLEPVQQRMDPRERLREAAYAFVEADTSIDSDEDFEKAEQALYKAAFALSDERRLMANLKHAQRKAEKWRQRVREGVRAARERGVQFGRSPKVTREQAQEALERFRSVRQAARSLGISRQAFKRALVRKPRVFGHGDMHPLMEALRRPPEEPR